MSVNAVRYKLREPHKILWATLYIVRVIENFHRVIWCVLAVQEG